MTENTLPTDLGRVAYEAESRWLDEIMPGVRTPAWDDLDPEHRGVYQRIAGAVAAAGRERIAARMDEFAANYPEDVFPAGSSTRDGISGTAMRHAYRNAAREIREPE